MITNISVSGFKSLEKFYLSFKPGLNILIGPNGSGKTNIVSFFEFLNQLIETDASEAVCRCGGAGSVFRKRGSTFDREIEAIIEGCTNIIDPFDFDSELMGPKRRGYIYYQYGFRVKFIEKSDEVVFFGQRLKLIFLKHFSQSSIVEPRDWDVVFQQVNLNEQNDKLDYSIEISDPKGVVSLPWIRGKRGKPQKVSLEESNEVARMMRALTGSDRSIISAIPKILPEYSLINSDLKSGLILNIVPSQIKLPEDSARTPGISRDGSGLAATLYALKTGKKNREDIFLETLSERKIKEFRPGILNQIKKYTSLVNDSITEIDVFNDSFDNKIRTRFEISSGDYAAFIPLPMLSDGTLKWLTIITAALTSNSVFSIEEPENYLHPRMQAKIVEILREILFKDERERFAILTTHSETLLNRCRPEELIVVFVKNGATQARRCSNAEDLVREMENTGFGLGYYFFTGAVEYE